MTASCAPEVLRFDSILQICGVQRGGHETSIGVAFQRFQSRAIFFTHQHMNWLIWLLMIYIALFAISQGAVVWVYISEVFPNRVRAKGQSLGSASHWVTNAAISLAFPVMAMSSGAYPFLFFCIMMVVDFFLVLFYYPETASISLERMQNHLVVDELERQL